MSYVDLLVQRSVQALDSDEHDWSDLSSYEFTDPVARITEEPQEPSDAMGYREAQSFIDKMTSTPRERRQGQKTFEQSTPGSSGAFAAAQAATGLGKLTTGQFVRKALAKKGMDYVWGGESKAEGGWDCSGLIYDIMRKNGFNIPRTSGEIIAHAKPMSVKKAMNTRGALLWHEGHIAISLGDGKRTIEAMNSDNDITIGSSVGRFTKGGMLPELAIGGGGGGGKRKKRRGGDGVAMPQMGDPLNKIEAVSSLNSANIVFGSVFGDVQYRPATKQEWNESKTAPGLHFVPKRYRKLITQAAERYGLAPKLIGIVMQKESAFNPEAVSSAGAQGLMQIMPLHGLDNPFNAKANVMFGAKLLASYIERMGSLRLGLAAYNAGPNNHEAGLGYADAILDSLYGRAA